MNFKNSRFITYFSIIIIALGLIFLANGLVLAWTPPSQTPPSGNVPAPINVGNSSQNKEGLNSAIGAGVSGGAYYWITPNGFRLAADTYWIYKNGESIAFKNKDGVTNFIVGRDGNVGIGTTAPTVKLDINGQIRIRGGSPTNGYVLTSDANGLAAWQAPASTADNDWKISGSNIFTGFANTEGYPTGNVGIGITTPAQKLDVNGWIKAKGLVDGDNQSYDVDPAATSDLKCIKLGDTATAVEKCSWPLSQVTPVTIGPITSNIEATADVYCKADEIRTGCSGGAMGTGDCELKGYRIYDISNGCRTYGKASSSACGNISVWATAFCSK